MYKPLTYFLFKLFKPEIFTQKETSFDYPPQFFFPECEHLIYFSCERLYLMTNLERFLMTFLASYDNFFFSLYSFTHISLVLSACSFSATISRQLFFLFHCFSHSLCRSLPLSTLSLYPYLIPDFVLIRTADVCQ